MRFGQDRDGRRWMSALVRCLARSGLAWSRWASRGRSSPRFLPDFSQCRSTGLRAWAERRGCRHKFAGPLAALGANSGSGEALAAYAQGIRRRSAWSAARDQPQVRTASMSRCWLRGLARSSPYVLPFSRASGNRCHSLHSGGHRARDRRASRRHRLPRTVQRPVSSRQMGGGPLLDTLGSGSGMRQTIRTCSSRGSEGPPT